jgi:hypothetical protein
MVRMLLNIRFFIGRIFGWDSELGAGACETVAMSDGTEARQTELTN